jgi:CDP-diglyceride synthetase
MMMIIIIISFGSHKTFREIYTIYVYVYICVRECVYGCVPLDRSWVVVVCCCWCVVAVDAAAAYVRW